MRNSRNYGLKSQHHQRPTPYHTPSTPYSFISDHLGTPQQLITATGLVVWQAAYLPYGEAQVRINLVENNLRFPGQYFDAESGLHYNWNRYYDAQTGRYISADPIGLEGGMNVYAYVQNNPINFIDYNGLKSGALDSVTNYCMQHPSSCAEAIKCLSSPAEKKYVLAALLKAAKAGSLSALVALAEAANDEASEDGSKHNPAQDKKLSKRDVKKLQKKLKEEGGSVEKLKTGGSGNHAGGYDLYVRPDGEIVTKPKGGKGEGEKTNWNTSEL